MNHELKCWPEFFSLLKGGAKTFDLRKNDRHFQRGDTVTLHKYDPRTYGGYCGNYEKDALHFRITYVLTDFPGLEHGYCILQLEPMPSPVAPIGTSKA